MSEKAKELQQKLTPSEALNLLMGGNQRFLDSNLNEKNYPDQVRDSAAGQYPFAAILGCIDSRVPAEIIFDLGIGDIFNIRVAGNIVNEDVLGSLEYACNVSGSKILMVLGHTSCGAITAAANNVEMGNITPLLKKIRPAIDEIDDPAENIDEIATENVINSIDYIRKRSSILKNMENEGDILIVGAIYDVASGKVQLINT